jgi:hypothetical protein
MIVVRVELWSAIDGSQRELARMMIDNQGCSEDGKVGDYGARTYRGRSKDQLDVAMRRATVTRSGKVLGHKRLALHIWHLVAKALTGMGYGAE